MKNREHFTFLIRYKESIIVCVVINITKQILNQEGNFSHSNSMFK